jgi:lysozyme family protein
MTINRAVEKLLVHEGGYSNHPADLGGETMCGIARRYWPGWPGWKLVDQMDAPKLTPELKQMVVDFYKEHFWNRVRASDMEPPVAMEVFEQAVNMGVTRASWHVQQALNLLNTGGWPETTVDGVIGPFTLMALRRATRRYETALLRLLNVLQAQHYLKLVERAPSQKVFLRGWLSRTV